MRFQVRIRSLFGNFDVYHYEKVRNWPVVDDRDLDDASRTRRDRLVAELSDQLEAFRTGAVSSAELAASLRGLVKQLEHDDLEGEFVKVVTTTAKQIKQGLFKPSGGKLPWALSSLPSTLTRFWGSGKRQLLYISMRIGGECSANAPIRAAENQLARRNIQIRPSVGPHDLRIDLVFDIPGNILWDWGFTGIRTGRYSRKEKMLQIQVAVPSDLSEDDCQPFLEDSLRRMVKLAREFAEDHRLGIDAESLEVTVAALVERPNGELKASS